MTFLPGIVLMTGPFERLLGFIPKGVIAGLFWQVRVRSETRQTQTTKGRHRLLGIWELPLFLPTA